MLPNTKAVDNFFLINKWLKVEYSSNIDGKIELLRGINLFTQVFSEMISMKF